MKHAYINGKIFTSDDGNPYAESMLIEDGVICWIGPEGERPQGDCPVTDLKGKRVIPGFVDAHMHAMQLADFSKKISCLPPQIHSIQELVEAIRKAEADAESGHWITGWGYDEGKLAEHRTPTRYDLDQGSRDTPVFLLRTCAHIACVNSKALELAGIDRHTPDPQGGRIERDENGEPTGILQESARYLVTGIMPQPTADEIADEIADLGRLLLSQGVVAVTDMGYQDDSDVYDYYLMAAERGLKQELAIYYFWEYFAGREDFVIPKERFDRSAQIRAAGLKLIADGSVSGRTAWVEEPYLGDEDEHGISVCADEILESAIESCKKYRCQLSIHAMGGRAIQKMVDRLAQEENWMPGDVPHVRLEHITEPMEASVDKAIEHGMAFVTQPIFLYAEIESYLKNLGAERTKKTYPVRHMLEKGVKLALSTDAPATSWAVPSDPFPNLKSAVTRTAYDGTDCGQDQAVDIETAICLYTRESAQAAGFEKLGQLKTGYKADFVVLSEDILEVDSARIDQVFVEKTYIKGELAYCCCDEN